MRFSAQLLKDQFKVVIAGGGAAGNAIANYLSRTIPVSQLALIDPMDKIHYQPGYSMIGANMIKDPKEVCAKREEYHPKLVRWFKNEVKEFAPKTNSITLDDGREVGYEFMVVSAGCQTRFDKIEGLPEGLRAPGVCSVYTYDLAKKTRDEIQNFQGGNAIFTHPSGKVKGVGAPQEICYLAEETWSKNGVRAESAIMFNTSLNELFGVPHYTKTLEESAKRKNILINYRQNLVKIDAENKLAFFELLDEQGKSTGEKKDYQYELLHVTPPCLPIQAQLDAIKAGDGLVDKAGWVAVDPKTLQNPQFSNVFALGDCCNAPTSKTAAAASVQFRVVKHNLTAAIYGKKFTDEYDGYTSCPLMVDSGHVALAEFNYRGPIETTPIKQAKPRYLSYLMNRYVVPAIYWKLFLFGLWNGPKGTRKFLHLGFSK